jgi:hypothetical protein
MNYRDIGNCDANLLHIYHLRGRMSTGLNQIGQNGVVTRLPDLATSLKTSARLKLKLAVIAEIITTEAFATLFQRRLSHPTISADKVLARSLVFPKNH